MSIFFITGTSGSGKSTLIDHLKAGLPKNQFQVYDFDEVGVPENADAEWRIKTTEYWLQKAIELKKQNKSLVVCEVVNPAEVNANLLHHYSVSVYFGFIKVDDEVIAKRLQLRGWNQQLIQDNINWAHYFEQEIKKVQKYKIFNATSIKPEEIANKLVKWIISPDCKGDEICIYNGFTD